MLIDKGISAGQVVTFKMSNGDEMIAKFIEETGNGYKISKPMVLSAGPQGIGMVPFMFTANHEKEIIVFKNFVMAMQSTERQFADQYTQGTTGIALS
jgi:hypothetical protein